MLRSAADRLQFHQSLTLRRCCLRVLAAVESTSTQALIVGNYSAGMADVRQGGTIGLPAKTLVNASMTLPPFLRMVEM